jgi:catechol 2,3-dioxygenase-like lactoylglutathione lyase family enzyme
VAHTGVSVPDYEAAVRFYRDVLGMTVLSPPYVMDNDAIRDDMDVAGVRTTWFTDPWGVVFILVEKSKGDRPYYAQWG